MERELWESLCGLAGMLYNRKTRAIYTDKAIVAVTYTRRSIGVPAGAPIPGSWEENPSSF